MKEVFKNLFICSQLDCERNVFDEKACSFVFAAKEPWHRQAVGYTGRACDKSHPEYLWAYRDGNKLILNMVDANSSLFFDKSMIDEALNFIELEMSKGKTAFIVCNKGESRSASIGLLYLIKHGIIKGETLEDCEAEYLKIYPNYNPGKGIREFMKMNWREYAMKITCFDDGLEFDDGCKFE